MKRTLLPVILLSIAVVAASGRSAATTENSLNDMVRDAPSNTVTIAKDIRYREGSRPAWVLDLAMPAAKSH